jgi:hypothetical protein
LCGVFLKSWRTVTRGYLRLQAVFFNRAAGAMSGAMSGAESRKRGLSFRTG